MRVLVTGAAGQLGKEVIKELEASQHSAVGVDIGEMDITNADSVNRVIRNVSPDAVIHCAAWTAVDAAEEAKNRDTVYQVNTVGTRNIAAVCKEIDCKLIYISTDYVFNGDGEIPWEPDDERKPLNYYGVTKCEGERCIEALLKKYFIVRTAWVFGIGGKNFVKTMLSLGKTHKELTVVADQIGTPTYTPDLSRLLVQMVESEAYGRYHATNEGGYISWFEFAQEIFRLAAIMIDESYGKVSLRPVSSTEFAAKAARPHNSRLDKAKLIENNFIPLPDWRDALKRFLCELRNETKNEGE